VRVSEHPAWAALRAEKPAMTYLLYYAALRDAAREHGYALALHGSLGRDLDVVAIPWTPEAVEARALVDALCAATGLHVRVDDRRDKPHGRRCWTLQGVEGHLRGWVDISVMPRAGDEQ
jgi:hypothetical protein